MARYHNYYVYICCNKLKTVLYVGVTNDLLIRMAQHRNDSELGVNSFCGRYRCYNLLYWEYYRSIHVAIDREKQLKRWSRKKKEALINLENPNWDFLDLGLE